MKIRFYSSVIFDALCACAELAEQKDRGNSEKQEFLALLREKTGDVFQGGALSFSTMCGIAARALPDLSTATLDELDKLFADMGALEKAVRSSIRDAFTASYMLPTLDMLKDGWAARYRTYIAVLKKAEFEQLWRERVRPAEQAQIERLRTAFKDTDISGMLGLISDMKGTSLESVSVCISLLSYPVAFSLCEGQFLDTVHEDDEEYLQSGFLSLIAHELMHGFASSELVEQYLTFMESNRYLRATHHALLTEWHSGDEEEFVMAAEYYILCRCGILTEEQIVQRNADRYNGCVPLSLYIFRHLVKEQPAAGYDGWLRARFSDGTFRPQEVVSVIDAILPAPSDQGRFFTSFFSVLRRCAYVIRSFQTEAEDMLRERLEAHTGCRFMPSADNVVRFGRERLAPNTDGGVRFGRNECEKAVPEGVCHETLRCGRLRIDALTFPRKQDALAFIFPYIGASLGPCSLEYEGENFHRPYTLVMDFPQGQPVRTQFAAVCGNTRYLITMLCPEEVVSEAKDTEPIPPEWFERFGAPCLETTRKTAELLFLYE